MKQFVEIQTNEFQFLFCQVSELFMRKYLIGFNRFWFHWDFNDIWYGSEKGLSTRLSIEFSTLIVSSGKTFKWHLSRVGLKYTIFAYYSIPRTEELGSLDQNIQKIYERVRMNDKYSYSFSTHRHLRVSFDNPFLK